MARDIHVFREVAGVHASYFQANTSQELAKAIQEWVDQYKSGKHRVATGMKYLTWKESAAMLLDKICKGETAKYSNKTEPVPCL